MPARQQKTMDVSLVRDSNPGGWLDSQRQYFYGSALFFGILFFEYFLLGLWWWGYLILKNPILPTPAWDLCVYWSASRVALEHGAAAAYDWALLRPVEAAVFSSRTLFGPFAYPPTFLLLIYPIGKLSFSAAIAVLSLCGIAAYLVIFRSAFESWRNYWLIPALAFPGVWVTLLAGQNSLFTMAAAGGALILFRRHPIASGACVAMLCIKPQLGVLFPLFLLCRRQWTALLSAALFFFLYLMLTWFVLGSDTFFAFTQSLAMFRHAIVENGGPTLYGAPTVFAMLRVAGCTVAASYIMHTAVSLLVVALCAWLWCSSCRFELRAATVPIASLLVQPYLIYYDLAWLAIPLALLVIDFAHHGCNRFEQVVLVATWLVPAQGFLAVVFHPIGQWAPAVLVVLLAVIARRARQDRRRTHQTTISGIPANVTNTNSGHPACASIVRLTRSQNDAGSQGMPGQR